MTLRKATLGTEAARRRDPGAGTTAASTRYRARLSHEWARGLTMTLDDAIAYALCGAGSGSVRRSRSAAGPPPRRSPGRGLPAYFGGTFELKQSMYSFQVPPASRLRMSSHLPSTLVTCPPPFGVMVWT